MNRAVIGLDFSGARDCGRRIWIAEGVERLGHLTFRRLADASSRLDVGDGAAVVMPALRAFLARARGAVIGGDFPVALARGLVGGGDGAAFLADFPGRFPDAEGFRAWCGGRVEGERAARRATDVEARTPFAPHNLRLYRQTWAAMAHLMGPLVRARAVAVAPFMEARGRVPLFLECCPASALLHLGLREPYKGPGPVRRAARTRILRALLRARWFSAGPAVRRAAVENAGGDALDALIAGAAAARAARDPLALRPRSRLERVEGRVYFT